MRAPADKLQLHLIEHGDAKGFAFTYNGDLATAFVAVLADPEGRIEASSGNTTAARWSKDRPEVLDGGMISSGTAADWAFAMLGVGQIDSVADVLHIPHAEREVFLTALSGHINDQWRAALPSVDERALAALKLAPAKSLSSLAFYCGDGERAVRRRQAAASYPLLAGVLSSSLAAKMAIDRSKPLAETVSSVLSGWVDGSVTKPVLKRLATADSIPAGCNLDTVVRFMSNVPADWIPKAGNEWTAFCHTAHALLEDLGAPESAIPGLVKGCSGKWEDYVARIVKRSEVDPTDRFHAVRQTMVNAREMVQAFAEMVVLPLAAHAGPADKVMATPEMLHGAMEAAWEILLSGRTGNEVSEMQRRFHIDVNAIIGPVIEMEQAKVARLRGEVDEEGWPGLTAPVQAPNGLWLVPLTNPNELEWEGGRGAPDPTGAAGLNHCVGGYAARAKTCDSHVVSVRHVDGDGRYTRLSTVEFSPIRHNSDILNKTQHHGNGNGVPAAGARDAVSWYMSAVAGGRVPLNRDQISAFLDSEIVPDDGVERKCRYDWRDRDMINTAAMPWGPYVTKDYRKNLDDLMDAEIISRISDMISPEILLRR